jgi:hypothetical protein
MWTVTKSAVALLCCLAIGQFGIANQAFAEYPEKPITIIYPWSPGDPVEVVLRSIGELASKALGEPFVINNVGGAGGTKSMTAGATEQGVKIGWGDTALGWGGLVVPKGTPEAITNKLQAVLADIVHTDPLFTRGTWNALIVFIALILFTLLFERLGYILTMIPLLIVVAIMIGAKNNIAVALVSILLAITCLTIFRYGLCSKSSNRCRTFIM